jgi:hypothetical protein
MGEVFYARSRVGSGSATTTSAGTPNLHSVNGTSSGVTGVTPVTVVTAALCVRCDGDAKRAAPESRP